LRNTPGDPGDGNLCLRRRYRQIVMTVEHRAAPGLADDGEGPAQRLNPEPPGGNREPHR